jgi:L-threonylcarbamoyladenylate synthase
MSRPDSEWDVVCKALNADDVVILPTETVYGLAARASSTLAVEKIYAIKGRVFNKPLAVCVKDIAQAEQLASFGPMARDLTEKYWPGSLTLVLDAADNIQIDPRALGNVEGVKTIALRCPDADWVEYLEYPLALTSANRSGEPDSVRYDQALAALHGNISTGMAATTLLSGAPSTIVRVSDGKMTLLRQGELDISI